MIRPTPLNKICHQAGLSLVEMMIAIFIQFLLLGGLVYIYVNSKDLYQVNEQLSRLQENGRYATNSILYDLRMAGYAGCRSLDQLTPNIVADPAPLFSGIDHALSAYEDGTGWTNPSSITHKANTDVLTTRFIFGRGTYLTGNMASDNANIQVANNPDGLQTGNLALIYDCQGSDLFRITSISNTGSGVTIVHASTSNTSNRLSRLYGANARVLPFDTHTYFIGLDTEGGSGLYQYSLNSDTAVLLVNGIQDMQFYYAEDNNGDLEPDTYNEATAVADWNKVIGVRMGLLVQSSDGASSEVRSFNFDGSEANTVNDRRLRQAFWSYAALRNKIK